MERRFPNRYVKLAALIIFTLLPFIGFYLGIAYYEATTQFETYDLQVKQNQLNSPRFQAPLAPLPK